MHPEKIIVMLCIESVVWREMLVIATQRLSMRGCETRVTEVGLMHAAVRGSLSELKVYAAAEVCKLSLMTDEKRHYHVYVVIGLYACAPTSEEATQCDEDVTALRTYS